MQLVWLNPDNNHELLWDHGMCADTSRGAAVRDLIARALKGPLAPPQQEVLQPCEWAPNMLYLQEENLQSPNPEKISRPEFY